MICVNEKFWEFLAEVNTAEDAEHRVIYCHIVCKGSKSIYLMEREREYQLVCFGAGADVEIRNSIMQADNAHVIVRENMHTLCEFKIIIKLH